MTHTDSKVGRPLDLPDVVLDADIAILGKKGGGKTYSGKVLVERLLRMGRRVLVLDPLGVWAGLRTAADGRSPGFPVAIFGGLHADLPLDPAIAEPMAQIIARENVPVVIDLSDLTKHAQQIFLLRFLHELRRVNTEALTIVLEEADVFAPQNPQGDDSKALHAEIDWIARRGRFKGFRLITITQRPARLSKDVLTQASTLIAHRLPAPQDREAIKDWVDGNGDREMARHVYDTVGNLAVGNAWIWATDIGLLDVFQMPRITTLDTSSTPKAGEERVEMKTLAQVDLTSIRAALEAATQKDALADTKAMRHQKTVDVDAIRAAEFERGRMAGWDVGYADGLHAAVGKIQQTLAGMVEDLRMGETPKDADNTVFVPVQKPPRDSTRVESQWRFILSASEMTDIGTPSVSSACLISIIWPGIDERTAR